MLNQNLLLAGDDAYNLTKSLRLRSSASAYLNRTPSTQGSLTTWTWSAWIKLGDVSTAGRNYFMCRPAGNKYTAIYITNNILYLDFFDGSQLGLVKSANVLRDPSAWYHIVVVFDTTNATASNRIRQYINGVQVTAFNTSPVYPSQNATGVINTTGQHNISSDPTYGGSFIDGYLTEVNFIDGQALTPSSFGSTNAQTGVWQPAKYTGTYGTNGFYLPFTDNSALTSGSNAGLGKDFSGNGNYWNTNNISITSGSTYDSMTDVPTLTSANTANYCVLNPLDKNTSITASNGNLTATTPSGFALIRSTMYATTTKYYWEVLCTTTGNGFVGISSADESLSSRGAETANSATINTANGNIRTSGTNSAYGSAVSNNDVMIFALDMTSGKFWAGKNGTWFNSGDPTAGTNAGKTGLTVAVSPSISLYDNENYSANFGQRPFAYTPPTGFVALNTYNLPTPTIGATASTLANKNMDATTYAGTSATQSITNSGSFQPDFIWIKNRTGANDNILFDSNRGTNGSYYYELISNGTTAENYYTAGNYGMVSAINSNGFTVASSNSNWNLSNATGNNYVAWQWKANGSAVSNTAGSITSQVSANTSAGFSVVTFTGTGSNATVGHGLGVAPKMIIVKRRDAGGSGWSVYFVTLPAGYVLSLQSTNGQANSSGRFTTTLPTSSVFSIGTDSDLNGSGGTYVAYCFSEIAGYSKFGSYTGNGSTDGAFIYTGFRPKFVLMKATTGANNWIIYDTARNTYNLTNLSLVPDSSAAENGVSGTTENTLDILSNGFKLRTSNALTNGSSVPYIYACFAENPFKYSLAR